MDAKETVHLIIRRTGDRTELIYHIERRRIATEILESNRVITKEGRIPDGPVIEHYRHGKVKRIMHYRNERPEGQSLSYYPTGELWEEQHFRNGKLLQRGRRRRQ
jgi:antitoxin component YwqK of YwqJK toxin-antitoxin module